MKQLMRLLAGVILLSSCSEKRTEVTGYAPVYGNIDAIKVVSLEAPSKIENGGKIYVAGGVLYQVEAAKGIHLTDISNPAKPVQKAFLKVAGAQEIAVKDGLIYTNSLNDLVILKIENNAVRVVKRMPATIAELFSPSFPPERGPFECPDKTKGTVIGWQKKMLTNPACRY